MPKKRWRIRGRRAASSHSSSPAKRTPTRPLDYRHDEPDDRLTVRARATGRGARSSRRTPQSVVPEKEKTGSYTTREPCLNGAEAEVVSRLPHTSRGVPHTRRGVGVRLGDGQGEDRLEAQEERSQIVHTFSVSDGTRSRARRGAGRYSPAGSRRPSRRAGRPRGLVGSAQVEEEASPVPWAGKPRRLGKKETISVGAPPNKKKQSCSRYHDCLYWSKKEWDWAIPPTNPIEWDWAIPRKKAK